MLVFNLDPIFKARGIQQPQAFLVNAGFHPATASKIRSSATRVLRLDHIELLCKILVCEPSDLLKWVPEQHTLYPDAHPLHKLRQQEDDQLWQKTLSAMPYRQLKKVAQQLVTTKEEEG